MLRISTVSLFGVPRVRRRVSNRQSAFSLSESAEPFFTTPSHIKKTAAECSGKVRKMLDTFRKFVSTCPLLKGSEININYLAEEPGSVSIEQVASEQTVRTYCGGGKLMQRIFKVCIRGAYDRSAEVNTLCANKIEAVADWLSAAEEACAYPENSGWQKIEITATPQAEYSSAVSVKLVLQVKIIYKI